MVPGEQLPAANSLNFTVFQFGAIVGPLLAGVMLRWVDLSTLYLIDAIALRRADLGDVSGSPRSRRRTAGGAVGLGLRARCSTASATWRATRWC